MLLELEHAVPRNTGVVDRDELVSDLDSCRQRLRVRVDMNDRYLSHRRFGEPTRADLY